MTKKNYTSVNEIIARNSHYILKAAQKGIIPSSVKTEVINYFSAPLAQQLKPLSVQSKILNISAPNASVATKARFEIGDVIKKIRQSNALPDIESIQIKVSTTKPSNIKAQPKSQHKPVAISPYAKNKIENMAGKIKDEHLRSALEKLTKK